MERRGSMSKAVDLPKGVSLAEWALEKRNAQNPRIRCFLGCIRLLDDVLESNFAILHCSPRRLRKIWSIVLDVRARVRDDLVPLLETRSKVPALDEAVAKAREGIAGLEGNVLTKLDGYPVKPKSHEIEELRNMLPEVVGRMHSAVMEALGRVMEADPRSQEDNDYFLSRQFARDVDDAEWLHTSVVRLEKYVMRLDRFRPSSLSSVIDHIVAEGSFPTQGVWMTTDLFLDELVDQLVPRLQKMIGLRGIRIEELQKIKDFVGHIPQQVAVIREISQLGREIVEVVREATKDHGCQSVDAMRKLTTTRLVNKLRAVDDEIATLARFLPAWRGKLTERRALAFRHRQK